MMEGMSPSTRHSMSVDDYAARFDEEPGYLDFSRVGPIGATVQEELAAQYSALAHARFGALEIGRAHV